VQLFLLPFSSHCSTKNIGFNDFGYVTKPPQPTSAIYRAPPFTGNRFFGCQNDTLKFCNDTLNSESRDIVLPCIEVKRFEEEKQQTAAMS